MDVIVIEIRSARGRESDVTHVSSSWDAVDRYMAAEALTYRDEPKHYWWAACLHGLDEIRLGAKEIRFFDRNGRPRRMQPTSPEIEAHPEWDAEEKN